MRGEGSLQWIEGLVGVAMYAAGIAKIKNYSEQFMSMVGVGWANVLGRMTPQQLTLAAAMIKSLQPPESVPKVVLEAPPEAGAPDKAA